MIHIEVSLPVCLCSTQASFLGEFSSADTQPKLIATPPSPTPVSVSTPSSFPPGGHCLGGSERPKKCQEPGT